MVTSGRLGILNDKISCVIIVAIGIVIDSIMTIVNMYIINSYYVHGHLGAPGARGRRGVRLQDLVASQGLLPERRDPGPEGADANLGRTETMFGALRGDLAP